MKFEKDFAGHEFIWFVGVVEARDDPLKLGRVRVRCFGWNPTDKVLCPTDQLPWAGTVQPVTAPPAASSGLTEGTWVFGFFMDGRAAQRPMVMGIIPGYRFDSNNQNGESELPRAARVEEDYPSPQSKLRSETRITDIGFDASSGSTWEEPEEPDDKVYPYVQTVSSEAGFITETIFNPNPKLDQVYDETRDEFVDVVGAKTSSARQVTYDCVGGYEERRAPSGDKIIKVVGNNYEVVLGSSFMNVKGDVVMTVEGSLKQNITGDYELNVAGNMSTAVGGGDSLFVLGGGTYSYGIGRNTSVLGADVCNIVGSKVETITGPSTRIITGTVLDTITGPVTRTITGAVVDTITGAVTRTIVGSMTDTVSTVFSQTASTFNITSGTHTLALGAGTITSAGSATIITINGTTITGASVNQGPINLAAHKHISAAPGSPTSPAIP